MDSFLVQAPSPYVLLNIHSIESVLVLAPSPYALVKADEVTPLDDVYDENGNIDFNDSYLQYMSMFDVNSSGEIEPSDNGTLDPDFIFDVGGNITPIAR